MKIVYREWPDYSLDQRYREMAASEDEISRDIGEAMLKLLEALANRSATRDVYGVVSINHLCLTPSECNENLWLVRAIGDRSGYLVEYRLPSNTAPWRDAYVSGRATSPEEAADMVMISIERSEAWAGTMG